MTPTLMAILFSVLMPSKMWYAPGQALDITVKGEGPMTLMLTDFAGKRIDADNSADVEAGKTVDLKTIFKTTATGGTYILYAVPKGKNIDQFVGTPLVVGVREGRRAGVVGPLVTRIEPLRYAVMTTDQGKATMIFYYDVAPNTANNFLTLAEQGYYDGLTFHRIVPGFVIQGGDPRGDGSGGPGYQIGAEFSDRKHEEGVLSMARLGDPAEGPGVPPRPEFANSAGSQFFVCLDYTATKSLDRSYTAFGKVIEGMDTIKAIAGVKLADQRAGKPEQPPVIKKIEVLAVTAAKNPYAPKPESR